VKETYFDYKLIFQLLHFSVYVMSRFSCQVYVPLNEVEFAWKEFQKPLKPWPEKSVTWLRFIFSITQNKSIVRTGY
jgi:hypothetical protein